MPLTRAVVELRECRGEAAGEDAIAVFKKRRRAGSIGRRGKKAVGGLLFR